MESPLPHAAGRIVAAKISRLGTRSLRHFLSRLVASTHPSSPRGIHIADNSRDASNPSGCLNAAANADALIVRVALSPGFTDAGDIPHVGMEAAPATEHVSAITSDEPPCAEVEMTSLDWPPRLSVRLVASGFNEKSG